MTTKSRKRRRFELLPRIKKPLEKLTEQETSFFLPKYDSSKVSLWRKIFCLLFPHREEIINEGYPRYNSDYHVHRQCACCGKERIEKDASYPKRSNRHPLYTEVITFYRGKHENV